MGQITISMEAGRIGSRSKKKEGFFCKTLKGILLQYIQFMNYAKHIRTTY